MASGDTILRTERLSRTIENQILVDNVTVEIYRGDVVAIVGPSGAGKSSFLRLINRLDEPTGGTVYLDERDYRTIPPRQLRQQVGMVMQFPYLFPGTVADNLRFGPAQQGQVIPNDQIDRLLSAVGLAGYHERSVGRLSGGEAQRVSLARTLANKCNVLLLDEPTSALDDAAKQEVEALIETIVAEEGLTALIVTHDTEQAERLATRIMRMEDGGRLVGVEPVKGSRNA